MKKRTYVVFLWILATIIATTAFIPLNTKHTVKENLNIEFAKNHPEAGYIEEIGN